MNNPPWIEIVKPSAGKNPPPYLFQADWTCIAGPPMTEQQFEEQRRMTFLATSPTYLESRQRQDISAFEMRAFNERPPRQPLARNSQAKGIEWYQRYAGLEKGIQWLPSMIPGDQRSITEQTPFYPDSQRQSFDPRCQEPLPQPLLPRPPVVPMSPSQAAQALLPVRQIFSSQSTYRNPIPPVPLSHLPDFSPSRLPEGPVWSTPFQPDSNPFLPPPAPPPVYQAPQFPVWPPPGPGQDQPFVDIFEHRARQTRTPAPEKGFFGVPFENTNWFL